MCVRWMVAILVLALIGCGNGDKAKEDNAPANISQRKASTDKLSVLRPLSLFRWSNHTSLTFVRYIGVCGKHYSEVPIQY